MPFVDFYTFLSEGDTRAEFPIIFECFQIKLVKYETGAHMLLARINPMLVRLDSSRFDRLLFLSRDPSESLFKITKWPVNTHVLLPLIANVDTKDEIMGNECIGIGWAELYRTEISATEASRK
jgi:hypothetical protein